MNQICVNNPTKNLLFIYFYNSHRCGVSFNQVLRDYSCQTICDSWLILAFTFVLDLAVENARTVIKYDIQECGDWRDTFLKFGTTSHNALNKKIAKTCYISAILELCNENVTVDTESHKDIEDLPDIKCQASLHSLEDQKWPTE